MYLCIIALKVFHLDILLASFLLASRVALSPLSFNLRILLMATSCATKSHLCYCCYLCILLGYSYETFVLMIVLPNPSIGISRLVGNSSTVIVGFIVKKRCL